MPTVVPLAAFSFDRVGGDVAVGRVADVELVDVVEADREDRIGRRAVGRGGPDGDVVARCGLAVQQRAVGDRDDAAVGVDGEAAAGVIEQRVGDRVGGRVRIAGLGGDAHRGAVGGVLVDRIGGDIAVGRVADVELVDVVQT